MDKGSLAFWSTVRLATKRAAHYAPSAEIYRAYETVIAHAEERLEFFRQAAGKTARPPTPPKPKSA
jgi:hypothetical protein